MQPAAPSHPVSSPLASGDTAGISTVAPSGGMRSASAAYTPSSEVRREEFLRPLAWSLALWMVIPFLGNLGELLLLLVFGAFALWTFFLILKGQRVSVLALIGYLCGVQTAMRLHAPMLPYLAVNYFVIVCGVLLLLRGGNRAQLTVPLVFYGFYVILEVIGLANATSLTYGRTILVPSLTILIFLAIVSRIQLNSAEVRRVMTGYLIGALTIVAIIAKGYISGQAMEWQTSSNFVASADMGPNQITIILAVAAFFCLVFGDMSHSWGKWFYWALTGICSFFMVMTFSRGGAYLFVTAVILYYLVLRRPSARTVGLVGFLLPLSWGLLTLTSNITQGKIVERYGDTDTSNRDRIAEIGWKMFTDNFYWGVGTGNFYSEIEQTEFGIRSGAHNEFTRAAAEHGILGLLCWGIFLIGGLVYAARGTGSHTQERRALRIIFFSLTIGSMLYNGLKLMVQPFLIMVALSAFAGDVAPARIARNTFSRRRRGKRLQEPASE